MRTTISLCVVCLSATVLLAQSKLTPMDVKTGLWQNTSIITLSGTPGLPPDALAKLTPEQRARYDAAMSSMGNGTARTVTSKSCLTQKDLIKDPFKDNSGQMTCQETVLNSTTSDLEIKESCAQQPAKFDFRIKIHAIDSEHAVGNGQGSGTMDGSHTMNSNMKMDLKWLGATCPADMKHDDN